MPDAVSRAHPAGIDALIDLASGPDGFAALAGLVRSGGTALTTRYVADPSSHAFAGVDAINFGVTMSSGLLERLVNAVASGRLVAPPITTIKLRDVPQAQQRRAVKTVIVP